MFPELTAADLSFDERQALLARAACSSAPVRGLTHRFYRYPARFSPEFAGAAIELFSSSGDRVLDPFMGGGTTIVEAFARGRYAFGSDINELSHFVTSAKTSLMSYRSLRRVEEWIGLQVERVGFRTRLESDESEECRNLHLPTARPIRKLTRVLLSRLPELRRRSERRFARCVLLRTAQWALDNRRVTPTLAEFKQRLALNAHDMVLGMLELCALATDHASDGITPSLRVSPAQDAAALRDLCGGRTIDLVVTSPPYPGVHILYHRWQVNGRRETDAPYWISASRDGKGSAYYNFADRKDQSQDKFFQTYADTLAAVRSVMRRGAVLVQMVACREPEAHLPRLVSAIEQSGFSQVPSSGPAGELLWRDVPNRKWHATLRGEIATSKELVLIHEAT